MAEGNKRATRNGESIINQGGCRANIRKETYSAAKPGRENSMPPGLARRAYEKCGRMAREHLRQGRMLDLQWSSAGGASLE